jgi:sugar O-acyltransferase (sialic acid O-acetyltransferase NeuD family)
MDIYLYGSGGHAQVVFDILRLQGRRVKAFADDRAFLEMDRLYGIPVYSAKKLLAKLSPSRSLWIVAIGDNAARRRIAEKLENLGHYFTNAIHPSAQIGLGVEIEPGSVVMANAAINIGSQIGRHAIINTKASIDHECQVGEYTHVAPGCAVCGQVKLGKDILVGVGSCIAPGLEVGDGTICGAGSVVVSSLPSHCLAYGSPAKVVQHLKSESLYGAK